MQSVVVPEHEEEDLSLHSLPAAHCATATAKRAATSASVKATARIVRVVESASNPCSTKSCCGQLVASHSDINTDGNVFKLSFG